MLPGCFESLFFPCHWLILNASRRHWLPRLNDRLILAGKSDSDTGLTMFQGRARNAHPLWYRLLRRLRRLRGSGAHKRHQVHFIRLGGLTCKRVIFAHASEAARVEQVLERFGPDPAMPRLYLRADNELVFEFVAGKPLSPEAEHASELLAAFFAQVNGRAGKLCNLDSTPYPARLAHNLNFLSDARLVNADIIAAVQARVAQLEPEDVLLGFDYLDALPKNLVVHDGALVGIDAEALQADCLLGLGLAKAQLRWLGQSSEALVEAVRRADGPDLSAQFDYARVWFLADYMKMKHYQGKTHLAPPELFSRWLDETSRQQTCAAGSASGAS